MFPPILVLLAIALWVIVFLAAIFFSVVALTRKADSKPRLRTGGVLVVVTAVFPALALLTIPFDDYARRWFPNGTPAWFVGCEVLFWVPVWFVLAAIVLLLHRPLSGNDWGWFTVLGLGVFASAILICFGISYEPVM